ncbi:MAG: sigma 54-interacting transcriptional regulator [Candidatus Zixiibacteriota bacterium]|nr:MAG: sigma 54-interacting transcriptional regulator [candidate division Zixibacteria bacterium]
MDELTKAEKLIRELRHSDALALLKSMSTDGLSATERAYCSVLLSEAAIIIGEPSLVHGLDEAIEVFRFSPDTARLARAKYAKGLWYSFEGTFGQAQEILLEAYTSFLRCEDLWAAARVLNRLAYVELQQGDVDSAQDSLEKAIEMYQSVGDKNGAVRISGNLAQLFTLTGRLKQSVATFKRIESHMGTFSEQAIALHYVLFAIPLALRGEIDTALATIQRSMPVVEKFPRQVVYYWQHLGWIHLLAGEIDAAESSLRKGLEYAGNNLPAFRAISLRNLLADVLCVRGKFTDAEHQARLALSGAAEMNDRSELGACYRVLGRVEHNAGNDNLARIWFHKAVDLFALMKYRYDLAVTLYEAAMADLYPEKEKARMLMQALDYFESEEVKPYIGRVRQELEKLSADTVARARASSDSRTSRDAWYSESPNVVAASPQMRRALFLAERAAPADMTVLLTGETGTGKDVLARYIHFHSGREGKLVSINAAAVPDAMVESELFGHVRGAFTGADTDKPGLFEVADGGTFYLNEIADASGSFQAKLLEVIETRKIRRLGENKERTIDFRLIAATNHNIDERIAAGQFRADLYHRLNEVPIHLPPLRERPEDMLPLVELFLRSSGFHPEQDGNPEHVGEFSRILTGRDWPGNIRQLRAEIDRLLLLSSRDLRRMIKLARTYGDKSAEHQRLLDALSKAGGNKSLAARRLGIPESTFRYRLKKYQSRR